MIDAIDADLLDDLEEELLQEEKASRQIAAERLKAKAEASDDDDEEEEDGPGELLKFTIKHTIITSRPGEAITTTREETHEVEIGRNQTVLELGCLG